MASHLAAVVVRRLALALPLVILASAEMAAAAPFTFAVRGSASVGIGAMRQDLSVHEDERPNTDDLSLIQAQLTDPGGASVLAKTQVIDGVIGSFATGTFTGSPVTGVIAGAGAGVIDYFTVALAPGSFVPISFTLAPSYSLNVTAGCAHVSAGVQVGGAGEPFIGRVHYFDQTCGPDTLDTSAVFMVPTGVPFRVLYELYATAFATGEGPIGTATADAFSSLSLFANAVGDFSFTTGSGNTYLSATPVPEPASLLLLGAGLAASGARRYQIGRRASGK